MIKRIAVIAMMAVGVGTFAADAPKADALANIPEAKDYQLVYDLDLMKVARDIVYDADNSAKLAGKAFDRIAYFIELQPNEGDAQYLYVSMDAFTPDAAKIGVPTVASGNTFQMPVANMNVVSNVKGIVTGTGLKGGNIEFWPTNYGQGNSAKVPNADDATFDFGDTPSPGDYGSMQVHNSDAKQTLFTLSHWITERNADIGIGNAPSGQPDWTFSAAAKNFKSMRLRMLVHLK
ncbi:MAG: hypothetical protein WC637_09080 [Victivallales bacterium]|jgi:sialate O-acetylesterase